MKRTYKRLTKSDMNSVKEILYGKALDIKNKEYEFNAIRRLIYGNEKILKIITNNGLSIDEISSGVSDRDAYDGYIKQVIADLNKKYYKNYYPSNGNFEARQALTLFENYKLNKTSYTPNNFCLTEGSTGAITMIFEYIKKYYPDKEILIQSPNYYLYKFASNYYNLKLKELMSTVTEKNPTFVSADLIVKNISDKTKLIILTNPANPSGETYDRNDLKKILLKAKEKNALVLVDELFAELVFEPGQYVYSDTIASKINTMNNLVIVKGYSKSKNLVGFRIGYLFSKNIELTSEISLIAQQRSSYSVASNFTGVISLDSFIQSVRWQMIYGNNKNYRSVIKKVADDFKTVSTIKDLSYSDLIKEYDNYEKYFRSLMQYYSERFDDSMNLLSDSISSSFPKTSAFNTIVKIKDLEGVNSFDFMINCFLATGLKTEIGPCFGFNQKTWDDKLGFWLRLTFAKDKKKFSEGIKKFIRFKKIYLNNPGKFLKTGLYF